MSNFFNSQLSNLVKDFKTKNEVSKMLEISRVRLHDILTEKHELKESTFKEYERKINDYLKVNFKLTSLGFTINELYTKIISDCTETMADTSEDIKNAERWVDINNTRIFFVFSSIGFLEITEIKDLEIITPEGELLSAVYINYIIRFINK